MDFVRLRWREMCVRERERETMVEEYACESI